MQQLSVKFPVWFCDIWGVVHNGYQPVIATVDALACHRKAGGIVILVTNSPRTSAGVAIQISEIGVSTEAYDAIVTSGDVTRDLMVARGRGKLFHLGPERDHSIFDDLPVQRVPLADAHAVLCTGLFDEENETPENYHDLLAEMKARNLLLICANPDKIVRKGDRLYFCAGALADRYSAMGGEVAFAGKPFAPIYNLAVATAAKISGKPAQLANIICIGDGPETDVLGAANFGLPVVLVADGVTDASLGLDHAEASVRAIVPHANIVLTVSHLSWHA
jgi:HAD superfamily hydrolase (TIGR01459 family)